MTSDLHALQPVGSRRPSSGEEFQWVTVKCHEPQPLLILLRRAARGTREVCSQTHRLLPQSSESVSRFHQETQEQLHSAGPSGQTANLHKHERRTLRKELRGRRKYMCVGYEINTSVLKVLDFDAVMILQIYKHALGCICVFVFVR